MKMENAFDESTERVNRKLRHQAGQEIVGRGVRGPVPGSGGRPLSDAPKDASYTLRLTRGELDDLKSAAKAEHMAVSDYIRDKLDFAQK